MFPRLSCGALILDRSFSAPDQTASCITSTPKRRCFMSQVRVFQCPACHEYIATDARSCRFCSTPIDAQTAQQAADAQARENKSFRRRHYARHMLTGVGLFAAGACITIFTYALAATSPTGGRYLITWGLML